MAAKTQTEKTSEELAKTAEAEAEVVRAKLEAAEQEAGTSVAEMARDAKEAVADTASRLRDKGMDEVEGARDQAAHDLHERARSFRDAAEDVRGYPAQYRAMTEIADRVDSVASGIENTDIAEIPNDVARFARRNPVLFLGGAAVLGFALARFVKASDRSHG